jgi:hypothetical protein
MPKGAAVVGAGCGVVVALGGSLMFIAALTLLHRLLATAPAAQMSFVKIVGQSLFNYLR